MRTPLMIDIKKYTNLLIVNNIELHVENQIIQKRKYFTKHLKKYFVNLIVILNYTVKADGIAIRKTIYYPTMLLIDIEETFVHNIVSHIHYYVNPLNYLINICFKQG